MLDQIITEFPSFVSKELGETSLETHNIDTGDAVPVKERHYPVSPAFQKLMYEELDRMLSLLVIEPNESPWNNRVTFVQKGDKVRLNSLTVNDAYPLHTLKDF